MSGENLNINCIFPNLSSLMTWPIIEIVHSPQRHLLSYQIVSSMNHIQVFCFRFMFDEPSSYLDVKQRLKAAQAIRSLIHDDCFIIVVEHDLSVLDYLSDFICCLYGVPGAYGVVTMPFSVREGNLL